jgi:hypothetical protein
LSTNRHGAASFLGKSAIKLRAAVTAAQRIGPQCAVGARDVFEIAEKTFVIHASIASHFDINAYRGFKVLFRMEAQRSVSGIWWWNSERF